MDIVSLAFAFRLADLCSGSAVGTGGTGCDTGLPGHVQTIINTLLTVAGAIAVLIIIVGGITYIASTGDSTRIKQAKDTILYAIIGLIVAILAYAIVQFTAGHVG